MPCRSFTEALLLVRACLASVNKCCELFFTLSAVHHGTGPQQASTCYRHCKHQLLTVPRTCLPPQSAVNDEGPQPLQGCSWWVGRGTRSPRSCTCACRLPLQRTERGRRCWGRWQSTAGSMAACCWPCTASRSMTDARRRCPQSLCLPPHPPAPSPETRPQGAIEVLSAPYLDLF